MTEPRWTVVYNIVSPESSTWVGTGWEFFDTEPQAHQAFERHLALDNWPTKRPFNTKMDSQHMGAAHSLKALTA